MIQKVIVEGVELEGRGNLVERAQIQPLVAEGMDHALAPSVLDHAVDLSGNTQIMEMAYDDVSNLRPCWE